MSNAAAEPTTAPTHYTFEFRGTGKEYFRIWIVNLALTILTLGIFSAWAKVRTRRYFNGNTFVAGHAFEYHAAAWRILIGRIIAASLLIGYELSVLVKPIYMLPWLVVLGFAFPWLVNASLRFNARNTSHRNVRFNFTGEYFEALVAYVIWPLAGFGSLFLLMPAARRARDYFWVNHHTFGGRSFRTEFSNKRIYAIFLIGLLMFIGVIAALGFGFYAAVKYLPPVVAHSGAHTAPHTGKSNPFGAAEIVVMIVTWIVAYSFIVMIPSIVETMIVNLALKNTKLDERHRLNSRINPFVVAWITVTNAILTLLTIGIFYPWARVRLTRYETRKLSILVDGDIDAYTTEALAMQNAVGEEIGSVFAFDFGL